MPTPAHESAGGIRQAGAFSEPEQWRYDRQRFYTREEWLDQLPTSGAMTRPMPDQLATVVDGVGAAIDALGATFTVSYMTVAVTPVRDSGDGVRRGAR